MKKQIAAILLITLALLSLFFSQQSGKQQVQTCLDKALIKVLETDYQRRINKEAIYLNQFHHDKITELSLELANTTEVFHFKDSIEECVAYQLAGQYILSIIRPLQPDEVNVLMQEQLKKEGGDCPTRIAYHYGDTLTRWSKNEKLTAWAHPVSKQDSLDIKGQMSVEAYADCPFSLIARLADWPLWPGGLLVLTAVGLLCFWRTAPKEQPVPQPQTPAVLTLNPADGSICAGDRQQRLPRMTFELLELLFQFSNQVVTRQQIIAHLWKEDAAADAHSYKNRIERHVLMLRKELAGFPDYRIETVPGNGYMLKGPESMEAEDTLHRLPSKQRRKS